MERHKGITPVSDEGAIVQVFHMGVSYSWIKDALILPRMKPEESIQLFPRKLWWLEYVTYAPVWIHLAWWIPVTLWVLWTLPQWTLATLCIAFFGFGTVWPLIEYLMHRFIFHASMGHGSNNYLNVLRFLIHGIHHAHPTDRLRIVTPVVMSILIAMPVFSVLILLVPDPNHWKPLLCGIVWGHVHYDYVHYLLHFYTAATLPGWVPWFYHAKFQRLHLAHANHHYASDGYTNTFGVSDDQWDAVFGTTKPVRVEEAE
jgi:dihydroceramide fatty acyl 2-hydroxylase